MIKLNGIEFRSKCIIVEEAKNKPTAFSEANALRPTSPVFGNHLTDEIQSKLPIGSAKKAYSETVHLSPNSSNTLIFTDSIAKGIRMYDFNRFIKNSKAKMFSFPGASSHLGYLNINSLRNKITDLRVIMKTLSLDYLILSETKIDESFPTSQFNVEGYEMRARRDRDKFGGGQIEFV